MSVQPLREEITGILYYPFLNRTHPRSEQYQVTLGQLDKETVKRFKEAGAAVQKHDEMGWSIILKNKMIPQVVDAQANPMTANQCGKVGKGTQAIVKVAIIPTKFANPSQNFDWIQILKLVEYTGGAGGSKPQPREGYVAGPDDSPPAEKLAGEWEEDITE